MVLLGTSLYADEGWLTNIEKAQEQAKSEKKVVLLEFTGSDWCPPCKALKKTVFDTDKFKAYAKKNLVLVKLDFPRDKSKITKEQSAYNGAQAKKFGVRGYPTVILLDVDGKELTKKVGFNRSTSVESYIEVLITAVTARITGRPSGGKTVFEPNRIKTDDKRGGKTDDKRGGKTDDKRGGKTDDKRGGKTVGPPNKVDGKGGKKPNREVLRKPGSNSGKKPQKGKKPDGEQGRKPDGERGGKPDGEQGGERLNWKELLGLTDEQAKKFHAEMETFRLMVKKINADKSMNPERKMKARDSYRKERNAKLAQILTEEQMKKFRKIWRAKARPSDGEGGGNEVIKTVTRQQRAAMAKLMRWYRDILKKILGSNLERAAKMKKIDQLKERYRQKRSHILSPEQARAWAAIDGIKPDGKPDGKPDDWKELLGLTGEQAKEFHAIMKVFLARLRSLEYVDYARPELVREKWRQERDGKLSDILTPEQVQTFLEATRSPIR